MNLKQLEEINLTVKARNDCKETLEILFNNKDGLWIAYYPEEYLAKKIIRIDYYLKEIAIIHVKNKLKEIDEKLKELGVYIWKIVRLTSLPRLLSKEVYKEWLKKNYKHKSIF